MQINRSPDVADSTVPANPELDIPENVDEEVHDIDINGVTSEKLFGVVGKKGKGKGRLNYMFKPDLELANPFAPYIKMVGAENWNRCVVTEILNPAAKDTTKAATGEDGMVSLSAYAEKFPEWFLPSTRKGGDGVKELREKLFEVTEELQPFLLRAAQNKPQPENEKMRFAELLAQWTELQEKYEGRQRKGKAKKAAVETTVGE